MMSSASRSRRVSIVAIIQNFTQLEKNYRKKGASIITDNCQDTVLEGFAPDSESAEILSKALGSKTVMSGSISQGKNDPSQSLLKQKQYVLIERRCYPAIGIIAKELKLLLSTVKRAIANLEKNGHLCKEQRWRENGGKSNQPVLCQEDIP